MATAGKLQRRRERRSQHTMKVRKSRFISSYVEVKYPAIYAEVSEYYNAVVKQYPQKQDLTKTVDYRAWQLTAARESGQSSMEPVTSRLTAADMDNFHLRIPLIDLNQTTDEGTTDPVNQEEETTETVDQGTAGPVTQEGSLGQIVDQTIGLDEVYPSIFEELAPGALNQLFEEIEADPELKQILEGFEEGLDIEYC